MVLDPIPQSLPVHFFGSRPQSPTSPPSMSEKNQYQFGKVYTRIICMFVESLHVYISVELHVCVCVCVCVCVGKSSCFLPCPKIRSGWRRPRGCLKLQDIFRKRATNYRALLRKITHKEKASYDSTPLCTIEAIRVCICAVYICFSCLCHYCYLLCVCA